MSKRIMFIGIWSLVFLVGSAALTLLAWRIYFGLSGSPERQPSEDAFFWFGLSAVMVPLAFGSLGVGLGIAGRLPATRKYA